MNGWTTRVRYATVALALIIASCHRGELGAGIAARCMQPTDCRAPYVCALGHCRVECEKAGEACAQGTCVRALAGSRVLVCLPDDATRCDKCDAGANGRVDASTDAPANTKGDKDTGTPARAGRSGNAHADPEVSTGGNGGGGAGGDATDAGAGQSEASNAPKPRPFEVRTVTDSAITYQIDNARTGSQPGDSFAPPFAQKWVVEMDGAVSYPLIVEGLVFVTVAEKGGATLTALDQADGHVVWGPKQLGGEWAYAVYDNGRVYAVNDDSFVSAFDASNGARVWTLDLLARSMVSDAPAPEGRTVYLNGPGSGAVFAVDEVSGSVIWSQYPASMSPALPAIADGRVIANYACQWVMAFEAATGAPLWQHVGSCSGAGGATPAVIDGRVYTHWIDMDLVLDAASGAQIGAFDAEQQAPAFDPSGRAFVAVMTELRAFDQGSDTPRWTFTADDVLSPPVTANGFVYTVAGITLYAIDADSGEIADMTQLPSIVGPGAYNGAGMLNAFAIGEGMLVTPAYRYVIAY